MTLGRQLQNVAQKARGRQALRYEFEVIPYFVGELPNNVDRVLFAWERGTKLFVTEAERVNHNTHAVFWKQYLRQTATIYKDNNVVQPKEYTFKVQSVVPQAKGEDKRSTLGKVKVDLAAFCTGELDPAPQDVFLQCKPCGKLKVSIKACWLRDQSVDPDAMTEVTEMTELSATTGKSGRRSRQHQQYDDEVEQYPVDEQDLTGFEHAVPSSSGHGDLEEPDSNSSRSKDKRKSRKGRGRGRQLPDEIPEDYDLPPDPDDMVQLQQQEGFADPAAAEQEHRQRVKLQMQAQAGQEEGVRIHKASWRDYVCCCCGPGQMPIDPQEADTLLSEQQASQMQAQNDGVPGRKQRDASSRKGRSRRRNEEGLEGADVGEEGGTAQGVEQGQGDGRTRRSDRRERSERSERSGREQNGRGAR